MTALGSSTSKKWVTVGIIVVIVALAGIVLLVSHTSSNHGRTSKDIAFAVAEAVYSNNARAFQGLFSDNPEKGGFVQQVSTMVQEYGPVKEVVSTDDRSPYPGQSSWKVVAERGNYTIMIQTKGEQLMGCEFHLPGGWFATGSM
ncbi:MAG: hypothetical protein NT018_09980 [Armatimonadetes bacterium]|nr:hypothetical protein [Armatimonadota bacterium]